MTEVYPIRRNRPKSMSPLLISLTGLRIDNTKHIAASSIAAMNRILQKLRREGDISSGKISAKSEVLNRIDQALWQ